MARVPAATGVVGVSAAKPAQGPYVTPKIALAAERIGFMPTSDSRWSDSHRPLTAVADDLAAVIKGFGFEGDFQWSGSWNGAWNQPPGRKVGVFVNGEESIQIAVDHVHTPAADRTFTTPARQASDHDTLGVSFFRGTRLLTLAEVIAALPPAVVPNSAADQIAKLLTSGDLDSNGLFNGYRQANGFKSDGATYRHSDGSWFTHASKELVVGFTDPATLDTVVVYPLRKPVALPVPDPVPTPPPPPPPPPKPLIHRLSFDDLMVEEAKDAPVELQPALAHTPPVEPAAVADAGTVVDWGSAVARPSSFEGQLRAALGDGVDLEQVKTLLKSHDDTVRASVIEQLNGFGDAQTAIVQAWREALPVLTRSLLVGHDESALPQLERLLKPRGLSRGLDLQPFSVAEARARMPRVANVLEGVKAELSAMVSSEAGHDALTILAFAERRATEVLDAQLREQLLALKGDERLALYAAGRRLVADVVEWAESL